MHPNSRPTDPQMTAPGTFIPRVQRKRFGPSADPGLLLGQVPPPFARRALFSGPVIDEEAGAAPAAILDLLANEYTSDSLRDYLETLVYLGQGVSGNVFSGAVPCSKRIDPSFASKKYVGKLFTRRDDAEKEYKVQSLVDRIDPLHLYVVPPIKFCPNIYLPEDSIKVLHEKIRRQGGEPKSNYKSQIVYPHGGRSLQEIDIISNWETSNMLPVDRYLFSALLLCAMTGYMNVEQLVYHFDIKEDNILYETQRRLMCLTDFEKSTDGLYEMTYGFIYNAIAHQKKRLEGPTLLFYTQFSPEVLYCCNLVRYISWRLAKQANTNDAEKKKSLNPTLTEFDNIFNNALPKVLVAPHKREVRPGSTIVRPPIAGLDRTLGDLGTEFGQKLFPLYLEFLSKVGETKKYRELLNLVRDLTKTVLDLLAGLAKMQDAWALSLTFYRFFSAKFPHNPHAKKLTAVLAEQVLARPYRERPDLIELHRKICGAFTDDKSFLLRYKHFISSQTHGFQINAGHNDTAATQQERQYIGKTESEVFAFAKNSTA